MASDEYFNLVIQTLGYLPIFHQNMLNAKNYGILITLYSKWSVIFREVKYQKKIKKVIKLCFRWRNILCKWALIPHNHIEITEYIINRGDIIKIPLRMTLKTSHGVSIRGSSIIYCCFKSICCINTTESNKKTYKSVNKKYW